MKKIFQPLKSQKGLTLAELLISMVIGVLILSIVSAVFILNQKVIRKSNLKAELTQNARIVLDLMSREIRQAREIITVLPEDDSDPGLIAHELQFKDGHTTSQIQYIRFYLDNDNLKRQIIVYYFETDEDTYVYWDDVDAFGPPLEEVLEEKTIGENFSSLNLYGAKNINIDLILQKQNEQIGMKLIINPRNI